CTLRDLIPEGAEAGPEADPQVARLKASARMVEAVEPAVALYEEPPTEAMTVTTELVEVVVSPDDWAEAIDARDPATPHNLAREEVLAELVDVLVDRLVDEAELDEDGVGPDVEELRESLRGSRELRRAVERAWPLIEPTDLVGDLWEVP